MRRGVLVFAVALALAACGQSGMRGELWYRARAAGGGTPSARDLERAATEVDLRIGEAGVERRSVSPVPPDRVRVVLPEAVVPRLAEIRAAIEKPEGLPLKLVPIE